MPAALYSCTQLTSLEVYDDYKIEKDSCLDWGVPFP